MASVLNNIPLNMADFTTIREQGFLYVDKTQYIETLLNSSHKYFIILRPKRFGKTIFLNTLDSFFRGREELFRGLYIHEKVKKFEKFPVLKLNMAIGGSSPEMLRESLTSRLASLAEEENIQLRYWQNPSEALFWLIKDIKKKYNKNVVILIDDYDKPMVDYLYNPEIGVQIRKLMRDFYLVLRESESNLHFVYLTGVIKLSQFALNTFLNNAIDLTFLDEFSTAFGYTREEFISNFSDRFEPLLEKMIETGRMTKDDSVVDLRNQILDYYDEYSWTGRKNVFSPYAINRYFSIDGPTDLWFKADNPLLLQNIIKDNINQLVMSTFQRCPFNEFCHTDVGKVNDVALMFYSGYLTVDKAFIMNGKYYYNLKIQSHERNNEFCNTLYSAFFEHKSSIEMQMYMKNIVFAIRTKNKNALEALLYDLILKLAIIENQKQICIDKKLDISQSEIDIYAPSPKDYDYLALDINKSEPEIMKAGTTVMPKRDFSLQDYLKHIYATRNSEQFNIKFQVALQSFFERHGFLTKPEILRVNRDSHIECVSKYETFIFKVNNIKPINSKGHCMNELLTKVAKNGLEYINYQKTRHIYDNSTTTIHKISIAISPFDKVKVEFAP
ncbi:MAG: AAA family ATPase [Deltaproteobacteria bacterium]|jgi:hypothetical protein|nr:AAA family ATPase [Deltaproteobacteria bacterium]